MIGLGLRVLGFVVVFLVTWFVGRGLQKGFIAFMADVGYKNGLVRFLGALVRWLVVLVPFVFYFSVLGLGFLSFSTMLYALCGLAFVLAIVKGGDA